MPMRNFRLLCLVMSVTTIGIVLPFTTADAYPQDPRDCTRTSIRFQFSNDEETWSAFEKARFVEAVERLETDAKDHNGSSYIQIGEVPVSFSHDVTLTVKLKDVPITQLGHADSALPFGQGCNDIWLNSNIQPAQSTAKRNTFWKVARHETFHIAGGHHAGQGDSRDGDSPPTMVTCRALGSHYALNTLSSDDEAYLAWLHNSLSDRQIHPNLGFEQGKRDWKTKNGSLIVANSSSIAENGAKYGSFFASKTRFTSYIRKKVRVWTGDDNEEYQSYGNVSKATAGTTASAMTRLYRRRMIEGAANGCSYEDGIVNPNHVTFGGWVLASSSGMDTSIASGNQMQLLAGGWENPPTEDGYVFEIRAYGRAKIGSSTTGLRWDNLTGVGT